MISNTILEDTDITGKNKKLARMTSENTTSLLTGIFQNHNTLNAKDITSERKNPPS